MEPDHKFEVRFEGVNLSDTDKAAIQTALQGAALSNLARLDLLKDLSKLKIELGEGNPAGMIIRG